MYSHEYVHVLTRVCTCIHIAVCVYVYIHIHLTYILEIKTNAFRFVIFSLGVYCLLFINVIG